VVRFRAEEPFVVPRGVEHRRVARNGEAELLLTQPTGTPNLGDEATAAPRTLFRNDAARRPRWTARRGVTTHAFGRGAATGRPRGEGSCLVALAAERHRQVPLQGSAPAASDQPRRGRSLHPDPYASECRQ
jgi:hypothetical protein